MAVYTRLKSSQVEQLLERYSLGRLKVLNEISSGIENTNYFLDTASLNDEQSHRYVLTVFENISRDDLPFVNDLTSYLAKNGFNVPAPVIDGLGETVFEIESKPGMIVHCMSGESVDRPSITQCESMAGYLAKMHLALREFSRHRDLERNEFWMKSQSERLEQTSLPQEDFALLELSISRYRRVYGAELQTCPQGIVHGDLFRDNVLFEGTQVSGVIDFYHACQATLLFDLAVMVNDWGWDESVGDYNEAKVNAITQAYQANRPWTEQEQRSWPRCLEVAALRFWISRLVSFYLPGYQKHSVEGDTAKNPDEMKAILLKAQAL